MFPDRFKFRKNLRSNWIWLFDKKDDFPNHYVMFRRVFTLEKLPQKPLQFFIYADTYYQLYMNGKFIGRGSTANHNKYPFFDEYKLGPELFNKENIIAIVCYHRGINIHHYIKGKPALVFGLQKDNKTIVCSDSKCKARLAEEWRSGLSVPRITKQMGFIEYFDARSYPLDWKELYFNDHKWQNAVEITHTEKYWKKALNRLTPKQELVKKYPVRIAKCGELKKRYSPTENPAFDMKMRGLGAKTGFYPKDVLKGLKNGAFTLKKNKNGHFIIFEFDRLASGFFRLKLESKAGVVIDIGNGEHLAHGRVHVKPTYRNFADRIITSYGSTEYAHSFRIMAAKYVELHILNFEADVIIKELYILETLYPVEHNNTFKCSDETLNKIWAVSKFTLYSCMHDHYEDCPWREQSQYWGDSRIEILSAYYAFSERLMTRKAFYQHSEIDKKTGFFHMTYPGRPEIWIPCYTMIYISSLYEYYLFTGDKQLLKDLYPVALKVLNKLLKYRGKDGILMDLKSASRRAWHIIDWDNFKVAFRSGKSSAINLFFLESILRLADTAEVLGKKKDAQKMWEAGRELKANVKRNFWDNKNNKFKYLKGENRREYSPHANAFAYFFELFSDADKEAVKESLLKKSFKAMKSLYFRYYLYRSVVMMGDTGLAAVLKDMKEVYGKMLASGAQTFWEIQDGPSGFRGAASLCHGWSSHPLYFLSSEVLGLKPAKPGFKEVLIKPNLLDLKYAEGKFNVGDNNDLFLRVEKKANRLSIKCSSQKPVKVIYNLNKYKDLGFNITVNGKKFDN